eukprot:gene9098-1401_t
MDVTSEERVDALRENKRLLSKTRHIGYAYCLLGASINFSHNMASLTWFQHSPCSDHFEITSESCTLLEVRSLVERCVDYVKQHTTLHSSFPVLGICGFDLPLTYAISVLYAAHGSCICLTESINHSDVDLIVEGPSCSNATITEVTSPAHWGHRKHRSSSFSQRQSLQPISFQILLKKHQQLQGEVTYIVTAAYASDLFFHAIHLFIDSTNVILIPCSIFQELEYLVNNEVLAKCSLKHRHSTDYIWCTDVSSIFIFCEKFSHFPKEITTFIRLANLVIEVVSPFIAKSLLASFVEIVLGVVDVDLSRTTDFSELFISYFSQWDVEKSGISLSKVLRVYDLIGQSLGRLSCATQCSIAAGESLMEESQNHPSIISTSFNGYVITPLALIQELCLLIDGVCFVLLEGFSKILNEDHGSLSKPTVPLQSGKLNVLLLPGFDEDVVLRQIISKIELVTPSFDLTLCLLILKSSDISSQAAVLDGVFRLALNSELRAGEINHESVWKQQHLKNISRKVFRKISKGLDTKVLVGADFDRSPQTNIKMNDQCKDDTQAVPMQKGPKFRPYKYGSGSLLSEFERMVALCVESVLHLDSYDTTVLFSEYGMQSKHVILLARMLGNALDINVPIQYIFSHPNGKELARWLIEVTHSTRCIEPDSENNRSYHCNRKYLTNCNSKSGTASVRELSNHQFNSSQKAEDCSLLIDSIPTEPVSHSTAIVGISCRFPNARTVHELFEKLSSTNHTCFPLPSDRISPNFRNATETPSNLMFGSCIGDVGFISPSRFRLSRASISCMDPQQRLLLELVAEAIHSNPELGSQMDKACVGVFVGISSTDSVKMNARNVGWDTSSASVIGESHAIASGQIAFHFNFKGPTMTIDTACSSSLVALHVARQSLDAEDCDFAVVAGVNCLLCQDITQNYGQLGMLSTHGRCFTFDKRADGYVRGEGCSVIILENKKHRHRHRETYQEHHNYKQERTITAPLPAFAELLGSSVNQDGRSFSQTAPNCKQQITLLRNALFDAGLSPTDVDRIEVHGTGTKLGDPIEFAALRTVFSNTNRNHPLELSCLKTKIGHLEACAGIASLVHGILSLYSAQVHPLNLGLEELSPHLNIQDFDVEMKMSCTKPLNIVGISSFGFSGTNAHVLIGKPREDTLSRDQVSHIGSIHDINHPIYDQDRCFFPWKRGQITLTIQQQNSKFGVAFTDSVMMDISLLLAERLLERGAQNVCICLPSKVVLAELHSNLFWQRCQMRFSSKAYVAHPDSIRQNELTYTFATVMVPHTSKTFIREEVVPFFSEEIFFVDPATFFDQRSETSVSSTSKLHKINSADALRVPSSAVEDASLITDRDELILSHTNQKKQHFLSDKWFLQAEISSYLEAAVHSLTDEMFYQTNFLSNEKEHLTYDDDLSSHFYEQVLKVVNDVMPYEVGFEEPLMEHGLDSVGLVQLAESINQVFCVEIDPIDIFDYHNVNRLAIFIANKLQIPVSTKMHLRPSLIDTDLSLADRLPPVCITGMACRLPGGVENLSQFWDILSGSIDTIGHIPSERFDVDNDAAETNNIYVKEAAFLTDIEMFDYQFFGINRTEATYMDPQQRLLLEVAVEALIDAGFDSTNIEGRDVAVFVGMSSQDWQVIQFNKTSVYSGTGSGRAIHANRISYCLGLSGASVSLDTACSASLVGLSLASQWVKYGKCEAAVVAGVNLLLTQDMFVATCSAGMLSPDCRCKTFDASANGYVRGEGCGAVVLQRRNTVEQNRVYASLLASVTNQDGKSVGLTAPNGLAQQALISKALQEAGLEGHEIDYVETHGTGTALGDPIEVG